MGLINMDTDGPIESVRINREGERLNIGMPVVPTDKRWGGRCTVT